MTAARPSTPMPVVWQPSALVLAFLLPFSGLGGCIAEVAQPVGLLPDIIADGASDLAGSRDGDPLDIVNTDAWHNDLAADPTDLTSEDPTPESTDTVEVTAEVTDVMAEVIDVTPVLDAEPDSEPETDVVDAQGVADTTGPIESVGCTSGNGLAEGESTFQLEGLERRYVVRLPTDYGTSSKVWPLVLALHGNGGSVATWDKTDGSSEDIRTVLADHAILIIAEAIGGHWRDYDMPSTYAARMETELLYFEQILTSARTELCINESAIFSMGFSGGGSFSGVLGCRRPDIAAIAVGGSVIYFDEADCVGTPAAWVTIGTKELNAGREAFRDFFRDRAQCSPTATPTSPTPCTAYDGCDVATPVHYCQHPDGHIWPDFASQAMWDFFAELL